MSKRSLCKRRTITIDGRIWRWMATDSEIFVWEPEPSTVRHRFDRVEGKVQPEMDEWDPEAGYDAVTPHRIEELIRVRVLGGTMPDRALPKVRHPAPVPRRPVLAAAAQPEAYILIRMVHSDAHDAHRVIEERAEAVHLDPSVALETASRLSGENSERIRLSKALGSATEGAWTRGCSASEARRRAEENLFRRIGIIDPARRKWVTDCPGGLVTYRVESCPLFSSALA